MSTKKPVSPYLRRRLRSLQEVATLRSQGAASAVAYGIADAAPPLAENNNAPAPRRPKNRLGAKSA